MCICRFKRSLPYVPSPTCVGDPMVNVRPGPVEHSHYSTGPPTTSKQPPSPVIHAKRSNNRRKNRRKKGTFDQPTQSKSLNQPEMSFSEPNTPGHPTSSVPLQEIMHEQYAEEVQSDEYVSARAVCTTRR